MRMGQGFVIMQNNEGDSWATTNQLLEGRLPHHFGCSAFMASMAAERGNEGEEIRDLRRQPVLAQSLREKLNHQKEIRELERRRTGKRRDLFNAQDSINAKREDLFGQVEEKLKQTSITRHFLRFDGD
jgi:hypothetical protein